jgi:hypothetical protein
MKKLTIALAITAAVVLTGGCGGGGGTGDGNGQVAGGQNNPGGGSGQNNPNQQQLTDLISSVDAQTGLDGHTVRITDPQNTTPNFKEHYFVFTPGNKVKFVDNRDNGDQFVYEGTYEVKTQVGFGNVIVVSYKNGTTDATTTIFLDDAYHVKSKQLDTFPAAVYTNENNGLVIKDNTPATGANALTVTSPNDVKGYTITSNEAHTGSGAFTTTQTITVKFECDGTFTETITTALSGQPGDTNTATGNGIEVDGDSLSWNGTNSAGESSSGSVGLDSNHQIVAGRTCFNDSGSGAGEQCANNLYVKTITQHATCQ